MLTESIEVTRQVAMILNQLGVRYAIGGSLATAVHGIVRATMDADIVADLQPQHAAPLVRALGKPFYADLTAIEQAIQDRTSFNVLHLETMFKVDVFVAQERSLDIAQLARRQLHRLGAPETSDVYVITAEDIVLAKLEWYRLGGQVSDRQWLDILGVLRVQADQLDTSYLRRMADEMGLADLLQTALAESH